MTAHPCMPDPAMVADSRFTLARLVVGPAGVLLLALLCAQSDPARAAEPEGSVRCLWIDGMLLCSKVKPRPTGAAIVSKREALPPRSVGQPGQGEGNPRQRGYCQAIGLSQAGVINREMKVRGRVVLPIHGKS